MTTKQFTALVFYAAFGLALVVAGSMEKGRRAADSDFTYDISPNGGMMFRFSVPSSCPKWQFCDEWQYESRGGQRFVRRQI